MENLYTGEVRKKSKVGIFFIHEKVWKYDFDRGKEPIQSHLSWKIGPLHIFFIICVDSAKEYLYSGEVRKKSKVEIFFYSWKRVKIWLWGNIYFWDVI